MKKGFDGDIPFSRNGHQRHYPERGDAMYPNFEFAARLEFSGWTRGRSAAYATFIVTMLTDKSARRPLAIGSEVVVFLSDFADMVPKMKYGEILGKFSFCKKGANYGCALLEDL